MKPPVDYSMEQTKQAKQCAPLAISMWDFSWLERRWPGAGYEDWDAALDELVVRGYNALRIDPYPHLLGHDPEARYRLKPVWNQQVWGSPATLEVVVGPALLEFLEKCGQRGIKVGLSSWYREDAEQWRMRIDSPAAMADNWVKTLDLIANKGLLDVILFVDLCNEWPGDLWCPYFTNEPPELTWGYWHTAVSMKWMRESIALVRAAYPALPLLYSFDNLDVERYAELDLSFMDCLEHHVWMVKENDGEFYREVEYGYERFDSRGYDNLVRHQPHEVYERRKSYWQGLLVQKIQKLARVTADRGLPLITTECWGIVDYKDWPMLPWDWAKELCVLGVETAAATGQWAALSTSNFCGPQFAGMWRDIEWHQQLTRTIREAPILPASLNPKWQQRLAL